MILLIFVVWMLFFDENSYLSHVEYDDEIKKLERLKAYYQEEIAKDRKIIQSFENEENLERFARETYMMKRQNEDIFIIEYDTISD
ncbi:FtsB family cell division protein [Aureivirga marina]|uniref:FtsB family cell division protein n=1 Tax=Aureivirga marina TaxID=1182451 RepID=UPI001E42280F|nr:septum formation initiator [Aureivirga marina]